MEPCKQLRIHLFSGESTGPRTGETPRSPCPRIGGPGSTSPGGPLFLRHRSRLCSAAAAPRCARVCAKKCARPIYTYTRAAASAISLTLVPQLCMQKNGIGRLRHVPAYRLNLVLAVRTLDNPCCANAVITPPTYTAHAQTKRQLSHDGAFYSAPTCHCYKA